MTRKRSPCKTCTKELEAEAVRLMPALVKRRREKEVQKDGSAPFVPWRRPCNKAAKFAMLRRPNNGRMAKYAA